MIKPDPNINKIIFSEYLVQKKIGKGSFGTVYQGVIISTNQKIALKFEKREKNDSGLLENEACRLYLMQGEGIPKIICYGNNQTHNILIQELLGNSLEQLFNINGRKFTLKTVCSIGIEMIKRIKFVHNKFHIHRDIKPDNFMTGREKDDNTIYIIDFGLAKKYYSISKNRHIKFSTGKNLIGTARYCGRNAHRGYEQGRRDDIESIGYVLMYFLNGILPWQGLKVLKGEEHFDKIAEKKYHTSFEELTKGHPEEFLLYFKHCDSLQFEDEPNYEYLISLFKNVIKKYCYDCLYDYDWKKNTIPNLSAIKDKEDNNNNKDISLIVHNNVSAIESKGEGKDEDKVNNIKLKNEVFIGEVNNNKINNINNSNDKHKEQEFKDKEIEDRFLKRNKSTNLLHHRNLIKDNLNKNKKIIDINDNNDNNAKNNNIFIVNNAITPKIQNINININFNNSNVKNNLNNEENILNQTDINLNKKIGNDLYKNEFFNENEKINQKINNYHKNIFNKKNIKKEYFFSYDQNMDDMVKSNKNSINNININYEQKKHLDIKKLDRFQKPKKLENLFTEEDIKSEDITNTNNNDLSKHSIKKTKRIINASKNNDIIKNSLNNSYVNKNNNKNEHKHEHHHNHDHNQNKNKIHHRNLHKNKSVINLKRNIIIKKENEIKNENENENIKNTNINISISDKKNNKLNPSSSKELNKSLKYNKNNKIEEKIKISENSEISDNNDLKRKRRNRVRSVDNKIRKNNPGCQCIIY